MTNKHRLLAVCILTLFANFLHSQTNTIKFKKIDSAAVVFSLAKMTTGYVSMDQLINDPIIRLETKKALSIKTCEITLSINGQIHTFRTGDCSELTPEQISIIESSEGQFRNRIFVDAIAVDENRKEMPLKTISLTITNESNSK